MKADQIMRAAKLAEAALGAALFLVIFWQLMPGDLKQNIRAHLSAAGREVDRYRQVKRERRLLESEHWHIGQIVSRYNAGYGPDLTSALALPPPNPNPPPRPESLGGPPAA